MEFFDICNEQGLPTGEIVERTKAHAEDILHRTAHIWVIRRTGSGVEVLLQKRAQGKDSFPGCYDTSSAGHIPAGEEPLQAAQRELREELGIEAKPEDLVFVGNYRIHYQKEFYGKMFRDNEIPFVYLYHGKIDKDTLVLQKEEVESVEWFTTEEITACLQKHDPRFCVPREGFRVLKEYLEAHPTE